MWFWCLLAQGPITKELLRCLFQAHACEKQLRIRGQILKFQKLSFNPRITRVTDYESISHEKQK